MQTNKTSNFTFLQWIIAQQLELASNKATDAGMTIGLYRDLAVGVSEGSAEIWGNKDLYCTGASVGAPPDILALGQNWGLPPWILVSCMNRVINLLLTCLPNMASSGSLRIDHVMALLCLWWVVKGDNAKDGGYVYYPVDDLLGILALESHVIKARLLVKTWVLYQKKFAVSLPIMACTHTAYFSSNKPKTVVSSH